MGFIYLEYDAVTGAWHVRDGLADFLGGLPLRCFPNEFIFVIHPQDPILKDVIYQWVVYSVVPNPCPKPLGKLLHVNTIAVT